ncbi:Pancreatic lipase-related protein 2 [Cyphomyrmex costatus]|uniref:phospholipase A1 n=1 Tax=Cyphomyrmex costatus TaxID=456900 RepID=A0A195CVK2_9HYME|nr:Pancreatic lipase-related protein 2 [Cyphomyrmex costatus]
MLYIIDTNESVLTQAEYEEISNVAFQTQFLLYTRNNRKVGEPLIINDNDSVEKSSWNPTHPTRIITHGWRGNIEAKSACTLIRDAYLSIGDYNVILIDWSKAAGSFWYWKVVRSVPIVAERVTQLIDFLQSQAGLDPAKTKVVGHSLGGHVVSLAARNANGDIAEAVALDPAKPLFDSKGPGERVDRSDAARVQVIHTSILGLEEPIGDADFYPNGGKSQPGCGIIALACAHSRSYEYYAESILNPTGFRVGKVFMGGPFLDPKNNPIIGQQLFIDDLHRIKKSFWNPNHPTRLIIHGWKGNCESTVCTEIRDAYLQIGDYNIILIDWRATANHLYAKSARSAPFVSQYIALLIDFLENNASLDPKKTAIIGYSLGGHIAGLSARFATSKIREVVALDPAGPYFESRESEERVDKTDAILVQVIHTSIRFMGIKSAIGTSDFYVNGGEEQPGCGRIRWIGDLIAIACAHFRALEYYIESVLNPRSFRAGKVFMGGSSLDPNACGVYILETADKPPFALG